MIFNGTSAKIADYVSLPDDRGLSFFKPLKSPEKMLIRTISIVTDAPMLAISAVITVMIGCVKILKAGGYFITGDFSTTLDNLIEAGISVCLGVFVAVLALISPVLNLVDLLGGIFNTLTGVSEENIDVHNSSLII